jgi:hypothetical protein
MRTYIRLVVEVARAETRCDFCPWVIAEYSSVYMPTIGAVPLGRYCNADHAERSQSAEVVAP